MDLTKLSSGLKFRPVIHTGSLIKNWNIFIYLFKKRISTKRHDYKSYVVDNSYFQVFISSPEVVAEQIYENIFLKEMLFWLLNVRQKDNQI